MLTLNSEGLIIINTMFLFVSCMMKCMELDKIQHADYQLGQFDHFPGCLGIALKLTSASNLTSWIGILKTYLTGGDKRAGFETST